MLPDGLFENLGVAKCGLDSKRLVIQPVTFDIGPPFFWLVKSKLRQGPAVEQCVIMQVIGVGMCDICNGWARTALPCTAMCM